jgi:sugar/nucleoside kinase (ribokinase family)
MDSLVLWSYTPRAELLALLPRVHRLCVNDEEALMLAQQPNVVRAAHRLIDDGVRYLIVKRAEHGATLFTKSFTFSVPAYPTATVLDPTGAGDAFAGGVLGSLARSGLSDSALRRSLLYGAVMGSLAVESFGTERLERVTTDEIERRFTALREMITL